jgi:peroxiredoxin
MVAENRFNSSKERMDSIPYAVVGISKDTVKKSAIMILGCYSLQ